MGEAVAVSEKSKNFPTHKGNVPQLYAFVFNLSHIFKKMFSLFQVQV